MRDKYASFKQLEKHEHLEKDYIIRYKKRLSDIVVIAPHGGGIEPGTTELAEAIAGEDFSFYTLEGLKRTGNRNLHITSNHFDEPKAIELVKNSKVTLAIHGCRGQEEKVYLGGLDEKMKNRTIEMLHNDGFDAEQATDTIYDGLSKKNICNKNKRSKGVQFELTRGLRSKMFRNLDRNGRKFRTKIFYKFVGAVRKVLVNY